MSQEAEIAKTVVENGPFAAKNIIPTAWMAAVAMAGGYVSFRQKMRAGRVRAFNITEFVGELFVSAFAGVITFWICKAFGVNEWLTAAGCAITGHMGSRAIFLVEQWIEKRGEQWK